MSSPQFVPAIGEQFNSVWRRQLEYKGFDLKFFTPKSHYEHDIALQSCYYGIEGVGKHAKANGMTFREMIGFPKDKTFVSDSAGFQVASFKKAGKVCNIKPIDSLRWQEENADIGMNLDFPPTLGKVAEWDYFKYALNESVKNFTLFEKERQNYKMKLYNVLHGETLPLLDKWYSKIKDFNFDGFAVGMKPPFEPMIQAMGFMYLYEKGEFDKDTFKGIHFFGTSGKHVVPTIAYAASKLKKNVPVTYDSSSYNIGSIYRTYYMPFDIGPHLSFGDKFDGKREWWNKDSPTETYQSFEGEEVEKEQGKVGKNPNITELPCDCPVCRSIDDIKLLNSKDIYAGTLISLHNLYQYAHYNKTVVSLVKDKDLFLEYLKNINISKKTLMSIKFIDFALEHGLKQAVKRYEQWLIPQTLDTTKQKSIFGF